MKQNPLISIIIPVYNAEMTLINCVNSVIHQTYKNIEILLIDDGSNDNSPHICDELSSKYINIKTIHKQNGGVVSARKEGIIQSKGTWIMFVDADDFLLTDTIEQMIKFSNNADIICCDTFYEKKGKIIYQYHNHLLGNERINIHISLLNFYLSGSSWGKLYKKELFRTISWPDETIKIGEDFLTTIALVDQCNRMVVVPKCLYRYVQLDTSAMHKKTPALLESMLLYLKNVHAFYKSAYHEKLLDDANRYILIEYYAYLRYGGNWDKNFISSYPTKRKLPTKISFLYSCFHKSPFLGKLFLFLFDIISHIKNK